MPRLRTQGQTQLAFRVQKGPSTRLRRGKGNTLVDEESCLSDSEIKPSPRRGRSQLVDLNHSLPITLDSPKDSGRKRPSRKENKTPEKPTQKQATPSKRKLDCNANVEETVVTPSKSRVKQLSGEHSDADCSPSKRRKGSQNATVMTNNALIERLSSPSRGSPRIRSDSPVVSDRLQSPPRSSRRALASAFDSSDKENTPGDSTPRKSRRALEGAFGVPSKGNAPQEGSTPGRSPARPSKDIRHKSPSQQLQVSVVLSPLKSSNIRRDSSLTRPGSSPARIPVDVSEARNRTPCKKQILTSPAKFMLSPPRVTVPLSQLRSPGRCLAPSTEETRGAVKPPVFDSPRKRAITFSPTRPVAPVTPQKSADTFCFYSPSKLRGLASPSKFHLPSPHKNVMSPVRCSPRKRVLFDDQLPQSPQKGSACIRNLSNTLGLAKQDGQCYKEAKQALHSAIPDRLVGREKERDEIEEHLGECLSNGKPGSMYISGAPGTGKTAVLSKVIAELRARDDCRTVYVNCMSFKNSQAIFNRVLSELQNRQVSLNVKMASKQLTQVLCSQGEPIVLILDEVDQLDSKNQEVLYTMFEWPGLPNSRLVMIGIANALDLTDRILPRLQAFTKCRPMLMNFEPYTKDQIVNILKDRIQQVQYNGECVLDQAAIRFCAMKVAAVAGDIRKALDICRRAVEMVEVEVKKQQVLKPPPSVVNSPRKSPRKLNPPLRKIGVAHIAKIVNEVYGSRVSAGSGAGPQTVPLQQKLAICTLLLMLKHGPKSIKEIPLGKLHEKYSKVCKRQEVMATDQSEFLSLCSLIEARGIIGLKRTKDTRNTKVTLKIDEKELETALQDKVLVSNILKAGLP